MSIVQPKPEFIARQKRIEDAFNLRKPDRIPVAPVTLHYYPTRAEGISNKDAMYQWGKRLQAIKTVTIEHDWDAAPPAAAVGAARPWELLGMQQVKWPGGGLRDDMPFQWVEKEYMLQNEYDEMLANPNAFAINKLWPRISRTLEPLSQLFQTGGRLPLLPLSDPYSLPGFLGGIINRPGFQDFLTRMRELGQEVEKNNRLSANYSKEMIDLGYPLIAGSHVFCAFDWISDCLRGIRGSSLDMYQVPDKLLATINMLVPLTIYAAVSMAKQIQINSAVIYLHRGSAGFMSDAQFSKFYWPCLKALIMGLIEAGVRPIVFTEGNYTPRLKYFLELPPKKFAMHYQDVDRREAKKILGEVACFWGNVSSSLMCTGTPQQIEMDVRELIEIFGDNGGLIIDGSVGIQDEAKPENVQALTDTVHKYGKN